MNIYPVETVAYFTSSKETSPEWYKAERMNESQTSDARYENLTGVRRFLARVFG